MILRLCWTFYVPIKVNLAFGDDFNDVGLFQLCGWPVAMGNAIDELKAIAKEVTESNDNDGVAMILERY